MNFKRIGLLVALVAAGACAETTATTGQGVVVVRLTDAPLDMDSVQSINVFVTRVDAKMAETDSAGASVGAGADSAGTGGWKTLATPNAIFNLKSLQNGVTTLLGATSVTAGNYRSLRLILDPSQSNIVLTDGRVLSGTSTPGIVFPSAAQTGIKVQLSSPLAVAVGDTTNLTLDFDAGQSFVVRGNNIDAQGLLFKPVITATWSR